MNIDEFKNTWNEDIVEETPEISLEQRNKLNLPLEKIRKNMRAFPAFLKVEVPTKL